MAHFKYTTLSIGIGSALAAALIAGNMAFAAPAPRTAPTQVRPTTAATAAVPASAELAEALTYMREEERLARDLYAAIATQYNGATPFSNITNSEQRHFDSVGRLLVRYGVEDPSKNLQPGTYAIPELQKLYDQLLAQSKESLQAAYVVGIAVEKQDIADLENRLKTTRQADVVRVFTQLKNGSDQHLAAFEAAKNGTAPANHGTTNGQGQNGQGQGQNGQGRGNGAGAQNGAGYGAGAQNGAGRAGR